MRTLAAWVLAAGIVAAGATLAQPPEKGKGGFGGGRGMGMGGQQGGGLGLLNNKSVQEELKITDEQKEKLKTFGEEHVKKSREKMQEMLGGDFQKLRDPEFQKKMGEETRKAVEEAMKEVKEKKLLDDAQLTRFKQIFWQQAGPHGTATDEEVQKVIKLTGEQKDAYKSMAEEYQKDMRELMRAQDTDGPKKIEALRKEIKEKAVEKLTPTQVAAWKELVGKEFEIKMEGQGGRTGGDRKGKRPEKKDPTN